MESDFTETSRNEDCEDGYDESNSSGDANRRDRVQVINMEVQHSGAYIRREGATL